MRKRTMLLGVMVVIFLLGITSTSTSFSQPLSLPKMVILYRYGPDGSVLPVKFLLSDEEDRSETLAGACGTLLEKDTEIQNFILNNSPVEFMSRVTSRGKGFHWKSPFSFRLPLTMIIRYGFFDNIKLRYKFLGLNVVPRIVCNYPDDINAQTEILPVKLPARQDPNGTSFDGPHEVHAIGFVGYAMWRGMNAQWFDAWNWTTGFDGYALAVWCTNQSG